MRVMLVTDSQATRRIEKNVLLAMGFRDFVEASDGAQALLELKADRVALVLTDWDMPKMNGLEFVKSVRAAGFDVGILMVTGKAHKPYVIQAMKAGVNGYVLEPFTPDVLKAKIAEVLKRLAASHKARRKPVPR